MKAKATKTTELPEPAPQLVDENYSGPAQLAGGAHDHIVQFYESDEFLVQSVSRFIVQGLTDQAVAVIIGTQTHLDALAQHLSSAGVEVETLVKNGRYLTFDAASTLQQISRNGVVDETLFRQHIGSLIHGLSVKGHRVYAFGEMVSLLWNDGKTESAIYLEALWNDLISEYGFDLFCAYPLKGFANSSAQGPFLHVCKAHSRVLPSESFPQNNTASAEKLRAIAMLQQKAASLENEIIERERAETTLKGREAELRSLVDTAPIGLHWTDENGIIVWANQAELELMGYPWDEYIGHSILEFHVDQDVIQDILRRLRDGERVRQVEARVRRKDGALRTVVIDSSVLWENGRFVHSQCFTRDVSAQRRAEELSQHLASIVEWSDDAIVSKDLNGVITSWNKSAERVFGYTADETVGRPITMLIPPDRLGEEPQILARLRRGERVDHFETVRRRKDGTLLDISLTISPIKNGEGKIVGASKIARDITERKRSEKALELARQELARSNAELERRVEERTASLREAVAQMEEFSYTVSHDLRAPLRGMQVYSQALLEDYGHVLNSEMSHFLRRIADNATRLDKMVTDVLTFSRVSRAELRFERIALDKLVRELVQQYPSLQKPVQIDVATLDDVLGHEPSVVQIVSNLLANAVKFVAPGVTPHIRVWTEKNEAGVKLFVEDNGIGIPATFQNRLFRMFERVHPTLAYEGTGVGLAIVRKAARRMGGDVGVISDGTHGATFWVQFKAGAPSA